MRVLGSRLPGFSTWLLFLALAGCRELSEPALPSDGAAFARAETETSVEVFLDDFTATLFCTNEEVHWTGKVIVLFHTTTNRCAPPPSEGIQHLVEVNSVHLTGTGLSSGGTYLYNASLNHSLQSPDPEDPFPTTDILTFRERIIGPSGGVIGFFTFTLRFVVSGTGEVVVEVEDVKEECR